MNYWIFIAAQRKADGEVLSGDEIVSRRAADRFWGLGKSTPNRKALHTGDQVVFYVGQPMMEFVASATLTSDGFEPSAAEREQLAHDSAIFRAEFGVRLGQVHVWADRRGVKELCDDLSFIENKEFWFAYFQGGVRQISEDDYRTICSGRRAALVDQIAAAKDLESDSEFALESHLEEFMERNWDRLQFGRSLELYRSDEQSGRQYPAGKWSIDFLCVDKKTRDFVVIELKRGKTSDSTVGQVLRYMSWVQENLAGPDKKVHGIIVAKEVDDALRYAVMNIPTVDVFTYKVDFQLSTYKKKQS